MERRILAKALPFIALAAALSLAHFLWDIPSVFDPQKTKVLLLDAGVLAPLLYVTLVALAVVVSPIPGLPLDIASGAVFGPLLGTLYSVIGGLCGAVLSFAIARRLGREFIERFLGGHINFCTECSDKLLTKIIFLSRLIPFISFDIVSYGAGLTKMSLKKFAIATFFGMIPMTFVYTSFGSVFLIETRFSVVMGLVMVVLFFLIPRWIEKRKLFSLDKLFQHPSKEEIPPHR